MSENSLTLKSLENMGWPASTSSRRRRCACVGSPPASNDWRLTSASCRASCLRCSSSGEILFQKGITVSFSKKSSCPVIAIETVQGLYEPVHCLPRHQLRPLLVLQSIVP